MKQNVKEAQNWVDTFIRYLKDMKLPTSEWMSKTSIPSVFQRVNRQGTTDAETAYSEDMLKSLQIGESTDDSLGPKSSPKKQAWNRVVYGPE